MAVLLHCLSICSFGNNNAGLYYPMILKLLNFVLCFVLAGTAQAAGIFSDITDRFSLQQFFETACNTNPPQAKIMLRALMPPDELINHDEADAQPLFGPAPFSACGDMADFNAIRQPLPGASQHVADADSMQWFARLYRLTQLNQSAYVSEIFKLTHHDDASFMHSAFARAPYITARVMAAAPQPLMGDSWHLLHSHMDRILSQSNSDEDKRLLLWAQCRDGREQAASQLLDEVSLTASPDSMYWLKQAARQCKGISAIEAQIDVELAKWAQVLGEPKPFMPEFTGQHSAAVTLSPIADQAGIQALINMAQADASYHTTLIPVGQNAFFNVVKEVEVYRHIGFGLIRLGDSWHLWYTAGDSSKAFLPIRQVKPLANGQIGMTLCIDDCSWWGKNAVIALDLTSLSFSIVADAEN